MTNDNAGLPGIFTTVFHLNPKQGPWRFRAKNIGNRRAPKVILSNDQAIVPGSPCRVRVTRIKGRPRSSRGYIEVRHFSEARFGGDDFFFPEALLRKLEVLLENRMSILLDGPQGSGKTVLARKVAESLGVRFIFFNCSAVYDPTDFLASLQPAEDQSKRTFTWVETDILRALTEAAESNERFLIFLDEFNRCREMARNGVMSALDATRKMFNPVNGEFIPIPENVQWIAAINNGAQFTGTTAVDPAQLDRFAPLKVDYPPPEAEARLLSRTYPDVPLREIRRVVKVAEAIRTDRDLDLDLSMRATQEACLLLSHPIYRHEFPGDPLPEILKDSFCARYQGRWDDPGSDAGMVWLRANRTLEG
ncbi:ATPase associated with various cellular activities AAA_5 [Pseudodesulfovibrio mercurii]|uniref:ATPase associated with various cellular activities AAA_5 n=1 Tax=Pseudodesulfovibrio mercurii TaxID=641491 RepID=F0JCI0_9BACT|nr:MoxR family ATPase [Pseudodesulfovibrio mercurii]EGB15660.1 ATPase associated with various cellular activities AAA_5 [Pseudodesulfovibrio mercurii]